MHAPSARIDARFAAPPTATPIRRPAAWIFFLLVCVTGACCATLPNEGALWPTPALWLSTFSLAGLIAAANAFGAFDTVEGLAEYATLGMPIAFAALLVLDWRHFVMTLALGEVCTAIVETVRRINPSKWYVYVFNVSALVVAGAVASAIVRTGIFAMHLGPNADWASPLPLALLAIAAVAWNVLDNLQTRTVIAFETGEPRSLRTFGYSRALGQISLLGAGIPFALAWHVNVWLSLLAIAPLAIGFRLLRVPELEQRVRMDQRTGLINAATFDRILDDAVDEATRSRETMALVAIDIDHFKVVNDTHGHAAGDAVILEFASVIASLARSGEIVARTGGEEFALLLRPIGRPESLALAERLRVQIADRTYRPASANVELAMTASIGVALFPEDGTTTRALRLAADAALYAAKDRGRNRVCAAERSTG